MRLTTIFTLCLLAASAQAADMQSASFSLHGGHANAGSHALMAPAAPSSNGLGSAGGTAGGGIAHGDSVGATVSLAAGYWAIESALAAAGSATGDSDADGVEDAFDNCVDRPNPTQLDADLDGFGNACDADWNNDGMVAGADYLLFSSAFGSAQGDAHWNPVVDTDGDGTIGGSDFLLFSADFGRAPGPSGLACADPTGASGPCTAP
jgi:hypothetical protein